MRIAVVGAGIAGLSAAWLLSQRHRVTLYEAAPRLGGHTNTVDVTLDGATHPVDTGFLVFNDRTYPNLTALFAHLGVETAASEMCFAVSLLDRDLEWAGESLATVFAQKRNLARPAFWGMLADILRFNREATRAATSAADGGPTLGEFLRAGRYGKAFRDWYLLPMAAAIWSCPTRVMLDYPLATFARFCHNHGLLQVEGRPQWRTVQGGAREYVRRIAATLSDVRLGTPVRAIDATARPLPRRHRCGDRGVRQRGARLPQRPGAAAAGATRRRRNGVILSALPLPAQPRGAAYRPQPAAAPSRGVVGVELHGRRRRRRRPRGRRVLPAQQAAAAAVPHAGDRDAQSAGPRSATAMSSPRSTTSIRCSTAPRSPRRSGSPPSRAAAACGSAARGPVTVSTRTASRRGLRWPMRWAASRPGSAPATCCPPRRIRRGRRRRAGYPPAAMNDAAQPRLYLGRVMHRRLRPAANRFSYRRVLSSACRCRTSARSRTAGSRSTAANLFSFRFADYGAQDGSHPLEPGSARCSATPA